ncbi:hypothetical protein FACS189429_2280 [Bacteroidia bacterium]|nr:hypothetical protein FACS189429_2280 [Bacteroidia bacterium]GHV44979.1 hypothetical protein FACS1894180_6990 [Bacteroidia bacterium]
MIIILCSDTPVWAYGLDNNWDDWYGDNNIDNLIELDEVVCTPEDDTTYHSDWWDSEDDDWGDYDGGWEDDDDGSDYNAGWGAGDDTSSSNNNQNPPPAEDDGKPKNYVPDPNDKMAKTDIPATMETQIKNTCVPAIMGFVNHLLGGNTNYGEYLMYYFQQYNVWIPSSEVTLTNLNAFVSHFFETTTFTDYKTAIDNGNVVMTDILVGTYTETTDGKEITVYDTHNVLVIGYDDDNPNNIIYMDSETGTLQEASVNYFRADYNIVITNNK